jgi:hypothetical protein
MLNLYSILKGGIFAAPLLAIGIGTTVVMYSPDEPAAEAPSANAASVAQPEPPPPPLVGGDHGFRFARVWYRDSYGMGQLAQNSGRGRGRGFGGGNRWATDWPTAEENLHEAIRRTTGFALDGDIVALSLADERIFDYPVLYLTEPGYWYIDEEEVANVQKYFERGGFMIIDDFHDNEGFSGREWSNMYFNLKQIFPDREPVPLPNNHPLWSIYYDIDPVEAPTTKGRPFTKYDDQYFGVYDDNGRMMVVISYNQDIGDGWEWPDRNLADASTISFQMAINMIMWAMTH